MSTVIDKLKRKKKTQGSNVIWNPSLEMSLGSMLVSGTPSCTYMHRRCGLQRCLCNGVTDSEGTTRTGCAALLSFPPPHCLGWETRS